MSCDFLRTETYRLRNTELSVAVNNKRVSRLTDGYGPSRVLIVFKHVVPCLTLGIRASKDGKLDGGPDRYVFQLFAYLGMLDQWLVVGAPLGTKQHQRIADEFTVHNIHQSRRMAYQARLV